MNQFNDYSFLLKNLMENTTDAIYFKDLESRFLMVNRACAEKHGWKTPTSNIGKTDFDVFSREHAEQAFKDEQQIIATGEAIHGIEEKETWPDGSVTWVSTTKMPLLDEAGRIIGTFGISRDITEHKEAELRAREYAGQIREIKEEMEEDVRMAGELQKNFSPSVYPAFPEGADPGCIEFLHRFTLCRDVSGDYCSIAKLSETEVGIFQCDVCGTGVRAALGTALVRGVMQEIAPLGRDPEAYMNRMNLLLLPLLHQEGIEIEVTACYITVDVTSGKMQIVNAGHPVPIHFHGGSDAGWLYLDANLTGLPLAAKKESRYFAVEDYICPDDSVVLYTDGLIRVKNNLGDPYGAKRLLDSAHSFTDEPLEDIFDGLENDALAFAKTHTFSDDVCLVGFTLREMMTI